MPEAVAALAARAIAIAEQAAQTQGAIVRQQGRSKRTIRLLAVSVAFDIALSVALIFLAVSQRSVSDQIHSSQVTACGIGNSSRVAQVQLWIVYFGDRVAWIVRRLSLDGVLNFQGAGLDAQAA